MAARVRASRSQQESEIFTERIKSGLKDVGMRKKQLEKRNLGAKVQEGKERIMEQAAEQHDKFTAMSSNYMSQ